MKLHPPHHIQPPAFGAVADVERLGEGFGNRPVHQGGELVEDAERHGGRPFR